MAKKEPTFAQQLNHAESVAVTASLGVQLAGRLLNLMRERELSPQALAQLVNEEYGTDYSEYTIRTIVEGDVSDLAFLMLTQIGYILKDVLVDVKQPEPKLPDFLKSILDAMNGKGINVKLKRERRSPEDERRSPEELLADDDVPEAIKDIIRSRQADREKAEQPTAEPTHSEETAADNNQQQQATSQEAELAAAPRPAPKFSQGAEVRYQDAEKQTKVSTVVRAVWTALVVGSAEGWHYQLAEEPALLVWPEDTLEDTDLPF